MAWVICVELLLSSLHEGTSQLDIPFRPPSCDDASQHASIYYTVASVHPSVSSRTFAAGYCSSPRPRFVVKHIFSRRLLLLARFLAHRRRYFPGPRRPSNNIIPAPSQLIDVFTCMLPSPTTAVPPTISIFSPAVWFPSPPP